MPCWWPAVPSTPSPPARPRGVHAVAADVGRLRAVAGADRPRLFQHHLRPHDSPAGRGARRSSDHFRRPGGCGPAGAGLPGQPDRRAAAAQIPYSTVAASISPPRRRWGRFSTSTENPCPLGRRPNGAELLGGRATRRQAGRPGPHHLLRAQARRGRLPRNVGHAAAGRHRRVDRRRRRPGPGAAAAGRDRPAVDARLGPALPLRPPAHPAPKTRHIGNSTARRPRRSSRWRPAGGCGAAVSARARRCGSQ